MALKLWSKDGKVIVDSNGKPIMCQTCPCVAQGNVHIHAEMYCGSISLVYYNDPNYQYQYLNEVGNQVGPTSGVFDAWYQADFNQSSNWNLYPLNGSFKGSSECYVTVATNIGTQEDPEYDYNLQDLGYVYADVSLPYTSITPIGGLSFWKNGSQYIINHQTPFSTPDFIRGFNYNRDYKPWPSGQFPHNILDYVPYPEYAIDYNLISFPSLQNRYLEYSNGYYTWYDRDPEYSPYLDQTLITMNHDWYNARTSELTKRNMPLTMGNCVETFFSKTDNLVPYRSFAVGTQTISFGITNHFLYSDYYGPYEKTRLRLSPGYIANYPNKNYPYKVDITIELIPD